MFKKWMKRIKSKSLSLFPPLEASFYRRHMQQAERKADMFEESIRELISGWQHFENDKPFGVMLFARLAHRNFYDSTWGILYHEHGVVQKNCYYS